MDFTVDVNYGDINPESGEPIWRVRPVHFKFEVATKQGPIDHPLLAPHKPLSVGLQEYTLNWDGRTWPVRQLTLDTEHLTVELDEETIRVSVDHLRLPA